MLHSQLYSTYEYLSRNPLIQVKQGEHTRLAELAVVACALAVARVAAVSIAHAHAAAARVAAARVEVTSVSAIRTTNCPFISHSRGQVTFSAGRMEDGEQENNQEMRKVDVV